MQDEPINNQNLISTLVRELIKEKKSDRRWRNIRFFLGFGVAIVLFLLIFTQSTQPQISEGQGSGYVALIRLDGMIAPGEIFSAENVIPALQNAFADRDAKGIVLDINSGGGTPVQASIIHDKILELKKKYNKKVIVVGEDMLASGAYFVAVAADKIYINPNTITGSIGVIMKGFGFPDLMKKIGVERRVYTAGVDKDRLDPFLPQNQGDNEKIKHVIGEVHDNFIQVVQEGRKGKLREAPENLFNGDFWSGRTALKLGLVDGLGNLSEVLRTEFHVNRFKDFSPGNSVLKTLVGQMGTSLNKILNESPKVLEKVEF